MRGSPTALGPFSGGINLRDSPMDIPQDQTFSCLNVLGEIDGGVGTRNGHLNFQSTFTGAGANDLSSLYYDVNHQVLITSASTKMYTVSKATGVVTDITGANILPANAPYSYTEAPQSGGQGPVFILPGDAGVTIPKQFNGIALADWTASSGTLDRGDFLLYFKNRIVMAGSLIGTNASGIKASAVGDPRNWDTSASGGAWLTSIDPYDGEKIYGLGTIGNYLVVFKKTKTYVVYDMDTGANRPISTSIGCTGRNTISSSPHGLIFLANDGHVYITDGTKMTRLSDLVDGTTDVNGVIAGFGSNNLQSDDNGQFGMPSGTYSNEKYIISIQYNPGLPIPTVWVYDFRTKAWWPTLSNVTGFQGFVQLVSDRQRQTGEQTYGIVRHITSNTPRLWKLFAAPTNADSTTAFNHYYETGPSHQHSGRPARNLRKRFHAMRGWFSGTVSIQHALDDVNAFAGYSTDLSFSGTEQEATILSLGVGNHIRFKFTSNATTPWTARDCEFYTQIRTD